MWNHPPNFRGLSSPWKVPPPPPPKLRVCFLVVPPSHPATTSAGLYVPPFQMLVFRDSLLSFGMILFQISLRRVLSCFAIVLCLCHLVMDVWLFPSLTITNNAGVNIHLCVCMSSFSCLWKHEWGHRMIWLQIQSSGEANEMLDCSSESKEYSLVFSCWDP